MSETCTKMREICGNYLLKYVPNLMFQMSTQYHSMLPFPISSVLKLDYLQYVNQLSLSSWNFDNRSLEKTPLAVLNNPNQFPNLKTLSLRNVGPEKAPHIIEKLKVLLGHIENLNLIYFNLEISDFRRSITKYCKNLKSLTVCYCMNGVQMFNQYLPKLENFRYERYWGSERDNFYLSEFLYLHEKLKCFECEWEFLQHHKETIMRMCRPFDELTINFCCILPKKDVEPIYTLLCDLYQNQSFKWLNFVFDYRYGQSLPILLQQISLHTFPVKRMVFNDTDHFNTDSMPQFFATLEHITIKFSGLRRILPFILYSVNLKSITTVHITSLYLLSTLDLVKLNNERKENPNARRIFWYLNDEQYV